ncbi:DMT family transporter [Polaromonas sp. A23]|uniref:DMT family transporter n=1 Tax=Polaromonas sp. A23 TaxID=1944133 RepID=UPI000984DDAA|nr:DMT family transporter [Polaromonas sp. A23]OOG46228.1 multidrug transporter [Polaromonas sp. A23]
MNIPALRGGLLALLAATLFGISTPLVQYLGRGLGPLTTAALLYAGAALAGALLRKGSRLEARLQRSDWRRLLAVVVFGAVIGPVALAWGLQRTSGASASLMLTLEALFTALLAWQLYRETLGARVWVAMALLLAGGAVLVLDQARLGGAQLAGLLAVLVATAAWGMDNTLSRALAERDPGQVVMVKAALGATATALLALTFAESAPGLVAAAGLLAVGATGYGLSLRFYLLAQRAFGAARTGSVFAFAPFIGAVLALALGDRSVSAWMGAGGVLMLGGVLLHLMESHGHAHEHAALDHEHAHDHADGHHNHRHVPMPEGMHSHLHHHESLEHAHSHVPDAHHLHRH